MCDAAPAWGAGGPPVRSSAPSQGQHRAAPCCARWGVRDATGSRLTGSPRRAVLRSVLHRDNQHQLADHGRGRVHRAHGQRGRARHAAHAAAGDAALRRGRRATRRRPRGRRCRRQLGGPSGGAAGRACCGARRRTDGCGCSRGAAGDGAAARRPCGGWAACGAGRGGARGVGTSSRCGLARACCCCSAERFGWRCSAVPAAVGAGWPRTRPTTGPLSVAGNTSTCIM